MRPSHQREELVAHVDERRARDAAAQLEREQAAVQIERSLEIADLEGHVVHADQPRPLLHDAKATRGRTRSPRIGAAR